MLRLCAPWLMVAESRLKQHAQLIQTAVERIPVRTSDPTTFEGKYVREAQILADLLALDGFGIFLSRTNADDFLYRSNENLAIPNFAGTSCRNDLFDNSINLVIFNNNLNF